MKAILFTAMRCPKCPRFRKVLREAAKEMNLIEGKDFVEKLIDGDKVQSGTKMKLEGQDYYIVGSEENIKSTELPAAMAGDHMIEALQYQIASTPALVINDEPAYIGEIPTKEELIERLKKFL